jgi:endonuclease/exonuclease/phosphatase family metal-dependent hydrolase
VLAVLAVLAGLLLPPRPSLAVDAVTKNPGQPVRVLTYNVCGASACQYTGDADVWTRELAGTAAGTWEADVLMLQEACAGQFDRLTAELEARHPGEFTGVFHTTDTPARNTTINKCVTKWGGKAEFGLATFVRSPSATRLVHQVTVQEGLSSVPAVLCTRSAIDGRMTLVCNTHLAQGVYNGTVMDNGISQVMPQVAVWAAGLPVILGGDFNAHPTYAAIRALRADLALGPWIEADEADDQPTAGIRKFDHVFVPARDFGSVQGTVDETLSLSDHRLLVAVMNPQARTASTRPGDLTGDGAADLLAVQNSGQLRLYPGIGGGRLSPYRLLAAGAEWKDARVVHRGDWTGDGWEDVVAALEGSLWVYPNTGTGELGPRILMKGTTAGAWSTNVIAAPGDMTGDRAPDLLVQSRVDGVWWLWPGTVGAAPGLGAPRAAGDTGLAKADLIAVGDIDGDRIADLWARHRETGAVTRHHTVITDGRATIGAAHPVNSGKNTWPAATWPLVASPVDGGTPNMWATNVDGSLNYYPTQGADRLGGTMPIGAGGWQWMTALS